MTAPTFDEIKSFIGPNEGNIPHMYLCTEGFVTVGIGNMFPNVNSALSLPFVNRTTSNPATQDEIKTDFEEVGKQPKGLYAPKYRKFTKLDRPDPQINWLFQKRVDEFLKQLRKSYPKFDTYPSAAQVALLDMAFQLGTNGLKTEWPKLNKAIDAEDWDEAAKNCMRPAANAIRNDGTKARFLEAAKEVQDKAKAKSQP